MRSRIYSGWVSHHRIKPHAHEFRYKIFMMYLDLDELPDLFRDKWLWSAGARPALAWFRRKDHVGDGATPLKKTVAELIKRETGFEIEGPVTLLTHLRYFGYCMNPVSFYYCWDKSETRLEFIVGEVNNTPWGERHCYVLDARQQPPSGKGYVFEFNKSFHISPFMPMDQRYRWQISAPNEDGLEIGMTSFQSGEVAFNAHMRMQARPITSANLNRTLLRHPTMTAKVISAIYWQAFLLLLKRTPFYSHPNHVKQEEARL